MRAMTHATSVLPTPVSVPHTKRPLVFIAIWGLRPQTPAGGLRPALTVRGQGAPNDALGRGLARCARSPPAPRSSAETFRARSYRGGLSRGGAREAASAFH